MRVGLPRHSTHANDGRYLEWSQVEFGRAATLHVRRAKNGKPAAHPLRGDEIRALRGLRRQFPDSERGGRSPIERNFVPDIVMRIMMRPATETYVAVRAPAGLLYTMTAPGFVPRHYAPLEYCSVGSGHGSVHEIAKTADWLLAGQPGNDLVESMALTDAVSEFVAAEGIDSCGGMFACLKIDHRGGAFLGRSMGIPPNCISLRFDDGKRRLVQQNEGTSKEAQLLLLWEINAARLGRIYASTIGTTRCVHSTRLGSSGKSDKADSLKSRDYS
jgi:hypothetical protein